MRARVVSALLGLWALGCSPSPRTQVMVVIDGDVGVRAGASAVDVRIDGEGELAFERTYTGAELTWPRELAIVPRDGSAQRALEIAVTAQLASGQSVMRTVRTGFVAGSTRVLYLRLESSCASTTCSAGQTCIAGRCADDTIDPTTLPEYGRLDAGMPIDGVIGCTQQAECDDGLGCTVDRCVSGTCERVADDARCTDGPGGTCDAVEGCRYPGCAPETCVAEGCETAQCEADVCVRTPTCGAGELCCEGVCWGGASCDELTPCRGRPAGTECRPSRGPCDVAEQCDGVSDACPPDVLADAGATCRGAVDGCDVAETCDGTSEACPSDALVDAGVVCRPAEGACDVAETCSGTSPICPTDAFAPTSTSCSSGTCDGLGTCVSGCFEGTPCSTGNPCERGEWRCGGGAPRCEGVGPAIASTVCRAVTSVCDVAETCTGTSTVCPADGFAPSTTTCRAAAGACDAAETCTGTSAVCPSDALRPSSFTCRAAAGPCDAAETCTGTGTACPPDGFRPSSFECRASAGACDAPERCTGASTSCPTDASHPSTHVCRPRSSACDIAELCDGVSLSCPPDAMRTTCPPTIDGVITGDEWFATATAVNTVASTWSSANTVTRLMAQVIGGTLFIAVEGTVENLNAMLVVVDSSSLGIDIDAFCASTPYSYAGIDGALSQGIRAPSGFSADLVWGNSLMGASSTAAHDQQGWRALTTHTYSTPLVGQTACTGTVCEASIPLSMVGGTPSSTIRMFARLAGTDATSCGRRVLSNQTVPEDIPAQPWVVSETLSVAP